MTLPIDLAERVLDSLLDDLDGTRVRTGDVKQQIIAHCAALGYDIGPKHAQSILSNLVNRGLLRRHPVAGVEYIVSTAEYDKVERESYIPILPLDARQMLFVGPPSNLEPGIDALSTRVIRDLQREFHRTAGGRRNKFQ